MVKDVVSADFFFLRNGMYNFDPRLLPEAR